MSEASEVAALRQRVAQLEAQLAAQQPVRQRIATITAEVVARAAACLLCAVL